MRCPQDHPLPPTGITAQFCPTCGLALINPCPVGHDNGPDARFCHDCGRPMGPESTPSAAITTVVPPTTFELATPRPTAGAHAVAGPPLPPPPGNPDAPSGQGHHRPMIVAMAVMAMAVVGVVIAVVATSSSRSTEPPAAPATAVTLPPATSSSSTTLSTQALAQGQALTSLLAQSAGSRSQVQAATVAIATCGDLAGAQAMLTAAQSSRQALVGQLGQLDVSHLPQSTALVSTLTNAWQSSADSDGSYAQWAANEQSKTCVPNDSGDSHYQAALVADGRASMAKQQFTSLWNPIATSLGLQQWQPNQF
jgi:hypothetical protein